MPTRSRYLLLPLFLIAAASLFLPSKASATGYMDYFSCIPYGASSYWGNTYNGNDNGVWSNTLGALGASPSGSSSSCSSSAGSKFTSTYTDNNKVQNGAYSTGTVGSTPTNWTVANGGSWTVAPAFTRQTTGWSGADRTAGMARLQGTKDNTTTNRTATVSSANMSNSVAGTIVASATYTGSATIYNASSVSVTARIDSRQWTNTGCSTGLSTTTGANSVVVAAGETARIDQSIATIASANCVQMQVVITVGGAGTSSQQITAYFDDASFGQRTEQLYSGRNLTFRSPGFNSVSEAKISRIDLYYQRAASTEFTAQAEASNCGSPCFFRGALPPTGDFSAASTSTAWTTEGAGMGLPASPATTVDIYYGCSNSASANCSLSNTGFRVDRARVRVADSTAPTATDNSEAVSGFSNSEGSAASLWSRASNNYSAAAGSALLLASPGPDTNTFTETGSSVNISNRSTTGNIATITTSSAHGFSKGDLVQINGMSEHYMGLRMVKSVPSSTSFTFQTSLSSEASAASSGTVREVALAIRPSGSSFTVTNKALSSNVATLTTSSPHGLHRGDVITVSGVDATFNGTYDVTAVTDNTVSYSKTASNVASQSSSGTITHDKSKLWPATGSASSGSGSLFSAIDYGLGFYYDKRYINSAVSSDVANNGSYGSSGFDPFGPCILSQSNSTISSVSDYSPDSGHQNYEAPCPRNDSRSGRAIQASSTALSTPWDEGLNTMNVEFGDWASSSISGSTPNTTTISRNVVADSTAPQTANISPASGCSGTSGNNGWYRSTVACSATASDANGGLPVAGFTFGPPSLGTGVRTAAGTTEFKGEAVGGKGTGVSGCSSSWCSATGSQYPVSGTYTVPEGETLLSARATDAVGNGPTATPATTTIRADATNPTSSITLCSSPDGTNSWYISTPTCTLAGTDGLSGIDKIEASTSPSGPWSTVASGTITSSYGPASANGGYSPPEGENTLYAKTTDVAGNSQTASQTMNIDLTNPTTAPTITASPAASLTGAAASAPAQFSFSESAESAAYPGRSGRTFQCKMDNGAWAACGSASTNSDSKSYASGDLGSVGYHTFQVRRVDPAGRQGPSSSYTWCADPTDSDSDGVGNMCDDTINATPGAAASCSDSGASSRPGNRDCASSLTVYAPKPQDSAGSAVNSTWNLQGQGAALARDGGTCSAPAGSGTPVSNCTLGSALQLSLNSGTSFFTLGSSPTALLSNQSNDSSARAGRVLSLDYRQPLSWSDENGVYSRLVTYTITTSP